MNDTSSFLPGSESHLHDEQLTDAVDGTAPADVSSHLATCAACRERLDGIRAAVQAVAAPPPAPTAAAREAAVARALDAATPSRSRTNVAPWMAAAALIALLLGGVGVVLAQRDSGREQKTAANRLDKAAGGDAGVARSGGVVDGGDLGDQADAVALNALLQQQLDGSASARALAAEDASSGAESSPPAAAATAAPSCVAEAQEAGSDRVGALVLTARLRWQGEPAVVLVFAGTDQAPLGRRAFVMAQRDCRLLVVQSF